MTSLNLANADPIHATLYSYRIDGDFMSFPWLSGNNASGASRHLKTNLCHLFQVPVSSFAIAEMTAQRLQAKDSVIRRANDCRPKHS